MTLIRMTATIAVIVLVPHIANGQGYFLDTFNDGNSTDGSPVSWTLDGGAMDASSGDLVLTTGNDETMAAFVSSFYSDSTITTKFRLLDEFEQFGQMSRVQTGSDGYYSELTSSGRISLFRGSTNLAQVQSGIDPFATDVWMQMRSDGDSITLRVWKDGSARPIEPQLSITDSEYSSGVLGLWFDPGNAANLQNASVAIRSFEVSAVPEPTSAAMMLLGSVVLFSRVRDQRRM